ncbi:MAG: hypothetical protein WBP12_02510 [Candidatus Saccharimonas sp.]
MSEPTNIIAGPSSRKRGHAGDGFFLEVQGIGFLVGRLLSTDAFWSVGQSGANMVQIFNTVFNSREEAFRGRVENLLIAPVLTNNLPWSKGYFQALPEEATTTFATPHMNYHFFHAQTAAYYDHTGRVVPHPEQPVGEFLLDSYLTIDDKVSDALGIERASLPR